MTEQNKQRTFILLNWIDLTDITIVLSDVEEGLGPDDPLEAKTFKTKEEAELWAKKNLNFKWKAVELRRKT